MVTFNLDDWCFFLCFFAVLALSFWAPYRVHKKGTSSRGEVFVNYMDPNFNPSLPHKGTSVTLIHLATADILMNIINRNWVLTFYRFSVNSATHIKIGQGFGAKQRFLQHTGDMEQGLVYLKT